MITIIYAHPLPDSLNASVLKAVEEKCKKKNLEYTTLDLYKDGFDPVLKSEERAVFFSGGVTHDPLVKRYQDALAKANRLVFIFPIWWNEQPAIVKGFIERVCLPNFAYEYTETGVAPLLTNIKETTILTTSGAPAEALTKYTGNIIENQFVNNIIRPLTGLKTAEWIDFGLMGASPEKINEHLDYITNKF